VSLKPGQRAEVEALARLFRCPRCASESLAWNFPASLKRLPEEGALNCSGCQTSYPLRDGILDCLAGAAQREVITPFQRLMQFPPIAAVYETYWRPLGFFIASSSSFRRFAADLIERIEPDARTNILDLACGPGLFACPLAARTPGWVIALDLSLPMLRRARRNALRQGLQNILFVRGNAFSVPFRSEAIEAVLCSGALHLFDRPESALAEIARILPRQGRFVCQTTLRPKHSAGLASFLHHIIRFGFFESAEKLNELLQRSGIQVDLAWRRRIIHAFQARRL